MKICMIGFYIGKSKGDAFVGGHVNNVVNLSKQLAENGHEIHIVTTYPVHSFSHNDLGLPWATVHPIKVNGYYYGIKYGLEFVLKATLKIKKLHEKENFDVVHGHSGHPVLGLLPEILSKINKLPSVHTLYCSIQKSNNYKLFSNSIFLKYYLSQLDMIVALSNNIKKSLKNIISDEKIRVIPPCIDTSLYNPTISGKKLRNDFGLNTDPTLLFLGNLTKEFHGKQKGMDVLIEALKTVKNDLPTVKLLMGLDIPMKKYFSKEFGIKTMIKSFGLEDNIIPLGIVKNMPQVMAATDVFVAPFLNTGVTADYPLSILEAMAVGKPVISTDVGGISEIIDHQKKGFLVKPNNSIELADAILYALTDKETSKEIGRESSKYVVKNFGIDIVTKKIEDVYKEVLK